MGGYAAIGELKQPFFFGCANYVSNEECDYSEDAIATSVVLQLAGVARAKAARVHSW